MIDILKYLVNKESEEIFKLATVSSLNPLQVKLYPGDDAINVKSSSSAIGMQVGSNVLMIKYLSKFIIISVIGNLNQNFCILAKTTNQSISNNTLTKVNFGSGTTISDEFDMHDEITNNTRVTILKDGFYNITISGRFDDSSTSGRIFYLYKNNAAVEGFLAGHDGNGRFGGSYSITLYLEEDDYLEFVVLQASGGALNLESSRISISPMLGGTNGNNFSLIKTSLIKSTTQSISTSTTTKITFSSSDINYDPSNLFDDSNNRIIIPQDGLYEILVSARWENSAGDNDRIMYIAVNGTNIASDINNVGTSGRAGNKLGIKKYLSANDYIEVNAWQDTGGSINIGGTGYSQIYFSVEKIK